MAKTKAQANKKVLLVEDEEQIITILKEKIAQAGAEVIVARNGEEGLKKAFDNRPDLILLDILMPGMDGIEMLKRLRDDKWGKKARVVVLTNLSHDSRENEARQYGVVDYWVKADWKISDLVREIGKKVQLEV